MTAYWKAIDKIRTLPSWTPNEEVVNAFLEAVGTGRIEHGRLLDIAPCPNCGREAFTGYYCCGSCMAEHAGTATPDVRAVATKIDEAQQAAEAIWGAWHSITWALGDAYSWTMDQIVEEGT